jgi:hypothetical protein
MRVMIGKFARSGIEAHLGPDLAGGVQAALRHYWRRLRSGTTPIAMPRLASEQRPDGAGACFELPVEQEIRLTLEREAARQATTVDRLLVHAILVYLSDLDTPAPRAPQGSARSDG